MNPSNNEFQEAERFQPVRLEYSTTNSAVKDKRNGFQLQENMILSSVTRDQNLPRNPAPATTFAPTIRVEQAHPAVEQWFKHMDTEQEGRISAKELQQAFDAFQGKHFSDAACKFVVRIFDLDKNGGIDIKEFETLYYYIKLWTKAFNNYDKEGKGFLDETELDMALQQLDIHFTPEFVRFLITRSNPMSKKMSLDQYIMTCIQIQRFTDEFKSRDPEYTGNINIKYEDFLEMILRCF